MKLVWKLLRQHLSMGQLLGFFFANLLGMLIVLLSLQFYCDVNPAFSQEDGFMKADYLVVSKKIETLKGLTGHDTSFSQDEVDDIAAQPFTHKVGAFTASKYSVSAQIDLGGRYMSTDLFFEAVPDEFVDVGREEWTYTPGDNVIPIVLPRSYLALYNFGFAATNSLPKLSEDLATSITITIRMRGNEAQGYVTGRVVGFSNRLNTILTPQTFIDWSNAMYSPDAPPAPTRLILQVNNPADARIMEYFQGKGYEIADDKLDAGKTTFFLRLISGIVMSIGLLISALSFYILMLSIYLLVQKNTTKLQNLLLIGYSPARVSLPYQSLTIGMNLVVCLFSLALLYFVRGYYLDMLLRIFPEMQTAFLWPALLAGLVLFLLVSLINVLAIRRKIMTIWNNKQ